MANELPTQMERRRIDSTTAHDAVSREGKKIHWSKNVRIDGRNSFFNFENPILYFFSFG